MPAARACAVSSRSPQAAAMAAAFLSRGAPRGEGAGLGRGRRGCSLGRRAGDGRDGGEGGKGPRPARGAGGRPGALQGLRRVPQPRRSGARPSAQPPRPAVTRLRGTSVAAGSPPAALQESRLGPGPPAPVKPRPSGVKAPNSFAAFQHWPSGASAGCTRCTRRPSCRKPTRCCVRPAGTSRKRS